MSVVSCSCLGRNQLSESESLLCLSTPVTNTPLAPIMSAVSMIDGVWDPLQIPDVVRNHFSNMCTRCPEWLHSCLGFIRRNKVPYTKMEKILKSLQREFGPVALGMALHGFLSSNGDCGGASGLQWKLKDPGDLIYCRLRALCVASRSQLMGITQCLQMRCKNLCNRQCCLKDDTQTCRRLDSHLTEVLYNIADPAKNKCCSRYALEACVHTRLREYPEFFMAMNSLDHHQVLFVLLCKLYCLRLPLYYCH